MIKILKTKTSRKCRSPKQTKERHSCILLTSQSGAMLIMVIISMVIMSIIGVAIYEVTTTATLNQVTAQEAPKAHYLSESGFRVASREYVAAAPANRNNTLVNLNGRTFRLPNHAGSFTIFNYPYWLYATTASLVHAPSLTLRLPGGLPRHHGEDTAVTIPARGIIKLRNKTSVGAFNNVTNIMDSDTPGTPSRATFTFPTGFPYAVSPGDEFYIGFVQNLAGTDSIFSPATQTVSQGGDLILNDTDHIAKFFPPENGTFTLALPTGLANYHYDTRVIGASTTTLTNIQAACGSPPAVCPPYPAMLTFTTSYPATASAANLADPHMTTQIYVGRMLGIRSTGTYGN